MMFEAFLAPRRAAVLLAAVLLGVAPEATTAPVPARNPSPVRLDGIELPVPPRSATFEVFGPNVAYVVGPGRAEDFVAWYRAHTALAWSVESTPGRADTTVMRAHGPHGDYLIHIQTNGRSGLISEHLEDDLPASAVAFARGLALRGTNDPLGVPLYPHRVRSKWTEVIGDQHAGLVSYATPDAFTSVVAWFEAHLSNQFARSYHDERPGRRLQTFHSDDVTVSIARSRDEPDRTIIGVQKVRLAPAP